MPKETGTENPYGYDPETNTVRVGQHDLARLLLMFRSLMREQRPGGGSTWTTTTCPSSAWPMPSMPRLRPGRANAGPA